MAVVISILLGCATLFVLWLTTKNRRKPTNPKDLPYPPGPKGLPLLGNALDMPAKEPWTKFAEWKKQYGDIIGLSVLGKSIIIVTSYEIVSELLDDRGAIYSDRPVNRTFNEHGDWGNFLAMIHYGESFHRQRKMLNDFLNPSGARNYHELLTQHSHELANHLLQHPDKFAKYNRFHISSVILNIVYGHKVKDENDEWINGADSAVTSAAEFGQMGAHPIDLFAILGKLPYRIWGKNFVEKLGALKRGAYDIGPKPYIWTKDKVLSGTVGPSIVSALIEQYSLPDGTIQYESDIYGSTGTVYLGGSDTSVTALDGLVLSMMVHPEIQKKAQQYIDEIISREDRLPELSDLNALPYISAMLKEILRWKPITPLGLPHASIMDDEYKGMFIPARSMIITDVMSMTSNENDFPDPYTFNPERYMDYSSEKPSLRSDVRDPFDIIFGFGRRACPGRHVAVAQMWIMCATLLSVFDIKCPLDDNGDEIRPDLEYVSSITSHPKPFKSVFAPRSERAVELLKASLLVNEQ
ncbi:cytochrome P450 [Sistotremastrum suecicum HHB10207 ss-3]|uniref:Cytochrome P450 n=1 Tax=Sistotremastrum suecicum HHB10207 ss-3 TaxID=1314776 RepID=A0A165WMI1_9AGAM|nr:cytochrome P450 [Sistotremastrum suecicum HHB10207 ss-3]